MPVVDRPLFKVVVLGDGGVGKTAIIIQLCLHHFVETYDPTIEDFYRKQVSVDGRACIMEIMDTAGQEDYKTLRDQWIQGGEGFLVVYSVASRSSFTEVEKFYHQIRRVKGSSGPSAPVGGYHVNSPMHAYLESGYQRGRVPVMVVGNKNDKRTEREVSYDEGAQLARRLGCSFLETSAKSGLNIEEAFFDVVRSLQAQREQDTETEGNGPTQEEAPADPVAEPEGGCRCVIL